MIVVHTRSDLLASLKDLRSKGKIAFVPTMGALHRGHMALVDHAKTLAAAVVVSIFVNPTQFGPHEDFSEYPRTLDADLALCKAQGVALVFAPSTDEIYPPGEETTVNVGATASHLDGSFRPGHFAGVARVCLKLFCLILPDVAVFGRKDYQQLQVLKRLVADFFLPIELVGHPTVREPDGLALSSRNRYLSADARERAKAIPDGLRAVIHAFEGGERRARVLEDLVKEKLHAAGFSIDYVKCADAETLVSFGSRGVVGERALVAVAAKIGNTRLIDNVVLGEVVPGLSE